MNQNTDLEDSLEAFGATLRSRPRLTDRVMNEIRRSAADGSTEAEPALARPSVFGPRMIRGRRRLFTAAAAAVAAVSVILSVAIMTLPSPRIGWADVTKAIQAKKWIRGTVTLANGKSATMWLSPEQEIWAFKLPGSSFFCNGPERVKYEFGGGSKTITKLPLGEDDAEKVLSMNALSQDKSAVGHWLFGTEKIVSQERREVTEDGKTWIEFQMTLWRGEMNQATLRVDPETRLPVYLLCTSATDPQKSSKWQFDYPADGPTDIYALGIPRETKIDDRMPSRDALAVLRAIAKSRAEIGNFRLIVGRSPVQASSVVYRKGDRWRVDSWRPRVAIDSLPEEFNEEDAGKWFEEELQLGETIPLLVCDGKSVWENSSFRNGQQAVWKLSEHTAPQDLMSGEGLGSLSKAPGAKLASLLFPDLSPKAGWGFEFDANPADAPGCVLLKRSAPVTDPLLPVGHEWYYLDPAIGYAVVQVDLFNLPAEAPGKPEAPGFRQTIRMENFRQSPQGFWYPTVVRNTTPAFAGIDPQGKVIQRDKTVTRYYFDFAADLPDSLFTIGDVQSPQK